MGKADSIPVFTELFSVEGIRLPDAAVFGAVWFYSYQDKKHCSKAPATLADELGLGTNTVRRSIAKLIEFGLIEDTTPEVRNVAHKLRLTEKGKLLLPERLPKMGNQESVTSDEKGPEVTQNEQPRLPKMGNEKKKKESFKDSTDKSVEAADTSHSQNDTLFPETEYELELFRQINLERSANGYSDAKKFPSLACKQKFDQAADVLNGETKAMITKARENVGIGIKEIVNYVAGCAKRAGKENQNQPVTGQGQQRRGTEIPPGQDSQADRGGSNAAGVSEAFGAVRRRRRNPAQQKM